MATGVLDDAHHLKGTGPMALLLAVLLLMPSSLARRPLCSGAATSLGGSLARAPDSMRYLQQLGAANARTLLQQAAAADTQAQLCISDNLGRLVKGCADTAAELNSTAAEGGEGFAGSNSTTSIRDSVIRVLKSCILNSTDELSSDKSNSAVRILLMGGVGSLPSLVKSMAQVYEQMVGIPVTVVEAYNYVYAQTLYDSLLHAGDQSNTHEIWMATPSQSGDGLALGAFKDISQLVLMDRRLQIEQMLPAIKDSVLYNDKIVGTPITAYAIYMMYRKDIFKQHSWQVPQTWWQLIELAQRINGTMVDGKPLYGFCGYFGFCSQMVTAIMRSTLASLIQTHTSKQGWVFDVDTMAPLFGSALAEAIEIARALYKLSPPDLSYMHPEPCSPQSFAFEQGKCLMAFDHDGAFKYMTYMKNAAAVGSIQGNLGVAPLPGSDHVLDRSTGAMRTCDPVVCPYAKAYQYPNGSTYYVNKAPGFDTVLLAVNAKAPSDKQFFAYSMLSYLTSPAVNSDMTYSPDTEVYITRKTQCDCETWASHGYNKADVDEYMYAYYATFQHLNAHQLPSIPGGNELIMLWYEIGMNATMAPDVDASVIVAAAETKARDILMRAFAGNMTRARVEYRESLGIADVTMWPAVSSGTPPSSGGGDGGRAAQHRLAIGLSVSLAVCVAAALAVLLTWYWLRSSDRRALRHPGPGPLTTLLVTDIENSTNLWEELDAAVMDASVKLHNTCIRRTVANFHGYESVWEGDSFIIAFHDPAAALQCCLQVQQELLQQPWPKPLLSSPYADELWLKPRKVARPAASPSRRNLRASLDLKAHFLTQAEPDAGISKLKLQASSSLKAHNSLLQAEPDAHDDTNTIKAAHHAEAHAAPCASPVTTPRDSTAHAPVARHGSTPDAATETTCSDSAHATPRLGASHAVHFNAGGSGSMRSTASPALEDRETEAAGSREQLEGSTRAITTLSQVYRDTWAACDPGTAGTVPAFRGLRVRMGLHAGVSSDEEIAFNSHMRRYHYTGPVRVLSHAIAACGHGGQTLLDTSTAALLGMDAKGALAGLPEEACLYALGRWELKEAGGHEAQDLLCVMPRGLVCRMAAQQAPLRKARCLLPGCLQAPLPRSGTPLYLACVQLTSLTTLLSWNKQETLAALADAHACALELASQCGGVVTEDGWALTRLLAQPASQTGLTLVFTSAHAAVAWALDVRNSLLAIDWSEALLAHSACERMGTLDAHTACATTCWRLLDHASANAATASRPGASAMPDPLTPAGVPKRPAPLTAQQAPAGLSMTPGAAELSPHATNNGLPRVASSGLSDSPKNRSNLAAQAAEVASTVSDEPSERPGSRAGSSRSQLLITVAGLPAGPPASPSTTDDRSTTASSALSASSSVRRALALSEGVPSASGKAKRGGVGKQSLSTQLKSMLRKGRVAGAPAAAGTQADDAEHVSTKKHIMVQDTPLLRGLRVKAAIASGSLSLDIAVRTSGCATYSGKGAKQLHKLLKLAGPGQVVSTLDVLQQAARG